MLCFLPKGFSESFSSFMPAIPPGFCKFMLGSETRIPFIYLTSLQISHLLSSSEDLYLHDRRELLLELLDCSRIAPSSIVFIVSFFRMGACITFLGEFYLAWHVLCVIFTSVLFQSANGYTWLYFWSQFFPCLNIFENCQC